MRHITVVDGLGLAHRAYNNSHRHGPAHRFFTLLGNVYRATHPTHLVLALDADKASLSRRKFDSSYKGNRSDDPPEGQAHFFTTLFSACEKMGLPCVRRDGWEGDDVMASIAAKAEESDKVCLATIDKDLLQAIRPNVKVYDYTLDDFRDEAYVEERYGITPNRMAEFLALVGDRIDNIPGVPGIGAKRAAALLNDDDSMESMSPDILSVFQHCLRLTELKEDLDLPDLDDFRFTPLDVSAADALLRELRARVAVKASKLPTLPLHRP